LRRIHKITAVGASSLMLTLALTPAALAAGTVSASSGKMAVGASGVKYKGKTSQAKACAAAKAACGKITLTKSSGRVSGTITWAAPCGNKSTLISGTQFKNAKLSGGKFAVSGKYTAPINNGQYEGHYSVSIAGTVGATKASGTFTGKSKIYSGSTLVTTCKSGSVTWHAKKV
jgi:hypothetical protein